MNVILQMLNDNFSPEVIAAKLTKVYEDALGSRWDN